MKMFKLVAALVIRLKSEEVFGSPISWSALGDLFDLSDDAIRHRVSSLKKKYNITDQDVLSDLEWNRRFLEVNCPESEKSLLEDMGDYWPGDIVSVENFDSCIIYDYDASLDSYVVLYHDNQEFDNYYIDFDQVDALKTVVDVVSHGFTKGESQPAFVVAEPAIVEAPQFLITPAVLVVVRNQQPLSIDKTHKNFEKIKTALEAEEWQKVFDLIDMKTTLTKYSKGRVAIEDGGVTLDGEVVSGKLVERLITLLQEENMEQLDALIKFMEKADDNPDNRVVTRIYDFMKANDIRIHEDGDILTYKKVEYNYLDCYTKTIDNSPGQVVKMKRNKVNPRDNETCSFGLHVCSKSYLNSYSGAKVLLCKVNPRDIVSIPTDYNDAKMRVCEYEVLKDVTENFTDEVGGLV